MVDLEERPRPGSLSPREFKEVFGVRGLPPIRGRPLVLFTGSGVGDVLTRSKAFTVDTIHGKAKLLVGEIEGAPGLPACFYSHKECSRT